MHIHIFCLCTGILKLSEETAHYFEIGIPKKVTIKRYCYTSYNTNYCYCIIIQFVPTEDEKLFINHSLELMTPYFRSNQSFDKIETYGMINWEIITSFV